MSYTSPLRNIGEKCLPSYPVHEKSYCLKLASKFYTWIMFMAETYRQNRTISAI